MKMFHITFFCDFFLIFQIIFFLFIYLFIVFYFLFLYLRLNLILFLSITQVIRCPCLERDLSSGERGECPCFRLGHLNLLNSLASQSLIPIITELSRITNETATLIDNILINQPNGFVSGILISGISDHLPLFILKQNLFRKKSSRQNTNVKYCLINGSTITDLRQSQSYYRIWQLYYCYGIPSSCCW